MKEKVNPARHRRMRCLRGALVAVSVMLFILWLVPALLFDLLMPFFAFVALGVVILVLQHTLLRGEGEESHQASSEGGLRRDRLTVTLLRSLGIGACILSPVPLFLTDSRLGAALVPLLVAIGVGALVFSAYFRPVGGCISKKDGQQATFDAVPAGGRLVLFLVAGLCSIALVCIGIACAAAHGFALRFFYTRGNPTLYRQQGSALLEETVTYFLIDWEAGSVKIEPYDGAFVEIVETCDGASIDPGDEEMRWYAENGVLHLRFDGKAPFGIRRGGMPDKQLTVRVPRAQVVRGIDVHTGSAAVFVRDIIVEGDLDVRTVSGKTELASVEQKKLKINTVSGDICLLEGAVQQLLIDCKRANVTVQRTVLDLVEFDSTTGSLLLDRAAVQSLKAETVSGDLILRPCVTPGAVALDTKSGDVDLLLPNRQRGFRAELEISSGRFLCEEPMQAEQGRYLYGDQYLLIKIKSAAGDVRLAYAE